MKTIYTILFTMILFVSINALVLILAISLTATALFGQTNGDYRTNGNVDFYTNTNWKVYQNNQWVNAGTPPASNGNTITVQLNDSAYMTQDFIAAGTVNIYGKLNVSKEFRLNSGSINDYGNINITEKLTLYGGSINVYGTLEINKEFPISTGIFTVFSAGVVTQSKNGHLTNKDGYIVINGLFTNYSGSWEMKDNFSVGNGGKYQQYGDGGKIPIGTWNNGSTCEILGIVDNIPSNINQNFYNFVWNNPSQTKAIEFQGELDTIRGNFTVASTGTPANDLRLNDNHEHTSNLFVGGNLNITGGNLVLTGKDNDLHVPTCTLYVAGSMTISNGNYYNIKSATISEVEGIPVLIIGGGFSINSGNFYLSQSGATASVIIAGDFTQTNGNVDLTGSNSSELKFGGNVTISGGSFNTTGINTIAFVKSGTQTFSSNQTFGSAMNYEVRSGSTLVLNSNFAMSNSGTSGFSVLQNGTLNLGANTLSGAGTFTLNSGASIKSGSPSGISTSGNIGNIQVTGTRTYNSAANYTYNATGSQVPGNGMPASITGNLTLASTGVLTLNTNYTTSGTLTLVGGNISIATGMSLTLSNSAPASLIYNSGYILGKFVRSIGKTTGSYLFPLGSIIGNDRSFVANFNTAPAAAGTIALIFNSNDPSINYNIDDNGYLLDSYSKIGYWQAIETGITTYSYTVNLSAQGIVGVNNYQQLRVVKRADSNSPWTAAGTHVNGTGSNSYPVAKRSTLASFSDFAIAGKSSDGNPLDGALPVMLSSFSSSVSGNSVNLIWITASELNNSGFEVQRSVNGKDWTVAGFVKGNGTTNEAKTYKYEDSKLSTGKYSYRLKQIDFNGNFEYHNLPGFAEVGKPGKFIVSQNYPNPFNPTTKISYQIPADGKVTIKIYDLSGREVVNLVNDYMTAGYYTVDFNAKNLASGIYMYKISSGDYTKIMKMMLIK